MIKGSTVFISSAAVTSFMVGTWMAAKNIAPECPAIELQENFDTTKFGGVWYPMLMSNDLPFGPVECQTMGIDTKADGSLESFSEWWDLDKKRFYDMNSPMACSTWESGKCANSFFLPNSTQPNAEYVATDYETFFIMSSCIDIAGIGYMQAIWAGSKTAYAEDSIEYKDFYDKIT